MENVVGNGCVVVPRFDAYGGAGFSLSQKEVEVDRVQIWRRRWRCARRTTVGSIASPLGTLSTKLWRMRSGFLIPLWPMRRTRCVTDPCEFFDSWVLFERDWLWMRCHDTLKMPDACFRYAPGGTARDRSAVFARCQWDADVGRVQLIRQSCMAAFVTTGGVTWTRPFAYARSRLMAVTVGATFRVVLVSTGTRHLDFLVVAESCHNSWESLNVACGGCDAAPKWTASCKYVHGGVPCVRSPVSLVAKERSSSIGRERELLGLRCHLRLGPQ